MFRRTVSAMAAMLGVATAAFRGGSAEVIPRDAFRGSSGNDHNMPPRYAKPKGVSFPLQEVFSGSSKASSSARRACVFGWQLHGPTGVKYVSYAFYDHRRRQGLKLSAYLRETA